MPPPNLIGITLVIVGVLALAYGGFGNPRETSDVNAGSAALTFRDREPVTVPIWLCAGAVLIGGCLVLIGARRKPGPG